jgi:hypothetical protein
MGLSMRENPSDDVRDVCIPFPPGIVVKEECANSAGIVICMWFVPFIFAQNLPPPQVVDLPLVQIL